MITQHDAAYLDQTCNAFLGTVAHIAARVDALDVVAPSMASFQALIATLAALPDDDQRKVTAIADSSVFGFALLRSPEIIRIAMGEPIADQSIIMMQFISELMGELPEALKNVPEDMHDNAGVVGSAVLLLIGCGYVNTMARYASSDSAGNFNFTDDTARTLHVIQTALSSALPHEWIGARLSMLAATPRLIPSFVDTDGSWEKAVAGLRDKVDKARANAADFLANEAESARLRGELIAASKADVSFAATSIARLGG